MNTIENTLIKTIRKYEDRGMFGYDAEDAAIAELTEQGHDKAALIAALKQSDEQRDAENTEG